MPDPIPQQIAGIPETDGIDPLLSETLLSRCGRNLGGSAIRELLANSGPDTIAFAGGYPDKEALLTGSEIAQLTVQIDQQPHVYGPNGVQGLMQYLPTEGRPYTINAIAQLAATRGIQVEPDRVFVSTSGSQGVLHALSTLIADPSDTVIVERPTYLGFMQAMAPRRPRFVGVDMDNEGIDPNRLEDELKRNPKTKCVYLGPTAQNPTGISMSPQRMQDVAYLAKVHDVLIVEDDPYSALGDKPQNALATHAPDHTLYVSTGSKIGSPGFRVGWAIAPKDYHGHNLAQLLNQENEGRSLFPSGLNQALFAEYVRSGMMGTRLPEIAALYRRRRQIMLQQLEAHLPDGYDFTHPDGGMFIWLTGPSGVDMREVLAASIQEHNVSFVPGCFFFAEQEVAKQHLNTARLNFTSQPDENIERGIEGLAATLRSFS